MKKYKLFGKIPIFDLIIIIILAAVVFVGYRTVVTSKSGKAYTTTEDREIILTVKFANNSTQIHGKPEIGEKVYNAYTSSYIGEVISSERVDSHTVYDYDSTKTDEDGNGILSETKYTDRYTLILKIKADAKVSDMCTEINGTKIGFGKSIDVSMKSLATNCVVIDIEGIEK